MSAARALLTVLAVGAAACSSPHDTSAAAPASAPTAASDQSGTFIAFSSDFHGYLSWPRFDLPNAAADGVGATGPRTVYLNRPPPAGARAFPVGTVIVKETDPAHPGEYPAFAMAKRGGGFDADGAVGWEWFEIQDGPDVAVIQWRGFGPPVGESYGGDIRACNGCHAAAADNDSVLSPPLRLSGL